VEKEAMALIRNNLNKANFFAFGIGSSVNRYIIEGMAHAGKGEPFIATSEEEARNKAAQFKSYIESPVLTHVKVSFKGFDAYDVEPLSIPDVFAQRPVMIMGKWKGTPTGKIILKGLNAEREITLEQEVSASKPDQSNISLKYLWAREKIRTLDDYENLGATEEGKKKITQLGLKYNLLTAYTSFIAIDSEVRTKDGKIVTVTQALPLPSGVSNYAIGESGLSEVVTTSYVMYNKSSAKSRMAGVVIEPESVVDKDEVTTVVAENPVFQGGDNAFRKFIKDNLVYPQEYKAMGLKGKVKVIFYVNEDGTITDIKVVKGLNTKIDAEVIRVIQLTSKMWDPGKTGGSPVRMKYKVTIDIEAK